MAVFIDGTFNEPKSCPTTEGNTCDCGGTLYPHYGFAGGYGLGGCDICMDCGKVWNFQSDEGSP